MTSLRLCVKLLATCVVQQPKRRGLGSFPTASNLEKSAAKKLDLCQPLPLPENNTSYLNHLCGIPLSKLTLSEAIRQRAADAHDANRQGCYFMQQNVRRTFAEIDRDSDEVAKGLAGLGYGIGDRIAIWGPNSYEWYISFLGIAKLGAVTVCLNAGFKQHELEHCMRHVGASALLTDHSFGKSHHYYPIVENLIEKSDQPFDAHWSVSCPTIPSLRHVIAINRVEKSPASVLPFDRMLQLGQKSKSLDIPHIDCHDILNMQFTSGTTGFPKAVMQTHSNVVNNAIHYIPNLLECPPADNGEIRICTTLPFFHSFAMTGILISSVVNGHSFSVANGFHCTESLLKCIEQERANNVFAVPTMIFGMLRSDTFDRHDLTSLREGATTSGGAPCPAVLIDEWIKRTGVRRVASAYGMTELAPGATSGMPGDTHEQMCNTIGYPGKHTEVKIAAENGDAVPLGKVGEICARGYHVMRGYWNDDKKTSETITPDEWLKTGDLGRMRVDGYVTIEGRQKEMIIRGGENIYPAELENLFLKHPAVKECYIIGVDDERMGEEVCAVVKVKSGVTTDESVEDALRTHVRQEVANFKSPRYYWLVEDEFQLPLTTVGKVQKLKLKELANQRFKKLKWTRN